MPGDFRCDLTNACAFYHYPCTRGYRAHRTPGIPCALIGRKVLGKARAHWRRGAFRCVRDWRDATMCVASLPPRVRRCEFLSFRGDAQHRTRNLEIPGSLVSLAPRNDFSDLRGEDY